MTSQADLPEDIKKRFDDQFKYLGENTETFSDGHYCLHHPDDPTHGEECYKNPEIEGLKSFIAQVVAEERKKLEEAAELIYQMSDEEGCSLDHHGYCQTHGWFDSEQTCSNKRALEWLKKNSPSQPAPEEGK